MVEFIADVIDSHATVNFGLELLNDDTDVTDELLDLCKFFDVLWCGHDFVLDLSELGGDVIVLLDGSVGDQFYFLLDDCFIFSDIALSNILDIDQENGNLDFLWNSLLEFFFKLLVSEDISSEPFSINWFLTLLSLVEATDVLVWVEFLFYFELGESLIILKEGLNGFGKGLLDGVIGIP